MAYAQIVCKFLRIVPMETHRPTLISVVLPAYNESEGLPIVLASIFGRWRRRASAMRSSSWTTGARTERER